MFPLNTATLVCKKIFRNPGASILNVIDAVSTLFMVTANAAAPGELLSLIFKLHFEWFNSRPSSTGHPSMKILTSLNFGYGAMKLHICGVD